ncbi:CRISPR-associated protein Cas4 [Haladaptatus sp. ZSTT2]|uniref:CRISPR-associated protein Cas4 n=1 Tax=Haladaptatus sp. ZSTT2 TaxID=3120515 RepID=UPI00300F46C4
MPTFRDLAIAAYCPRQLYYERREADRSPPPEVAAKRKLAFQYPELLEVDELPTEIAVTPTQFRTNLHCARARFDRFDELADPADERVLLTGKDARGIAHKVIDDPPAPSLVFTGSPPPNGVWHPQTVHAVAAAKALSWERETPVERAFVEYPTHGIVREVCLTTRKKATYRRALRTVRALDGPPPRLNNREKCGACDFRTKCGVKTRSLRSLLS